MRLKSIDKEEDKNVFQNSSEVQENQIENNREEESTQPQNKKSKWKGILGELLIYAFIAFVCIFVIPRYVIQRTYVSGESMESTLQSEDHILVEKVSYYFHEPKRFDIVVFEPYADKTEEEYAAEYRVKDGEKQKEYYVKRVIGLPGETIQIVDSAIYIDGKPLTDDHYGKDPITEAGIAAEPIILEKDEYFLLGDNREVSLDSRYEEIGPVKRQHLIGRACVRILPLNKFGFFE